MTNDNGLTRPDTIPQAMWDWMDKANKTKALTLKPANLAKQVAVFKAAHADLLTEQTEQEIDVDVVTDTTVAEAKAAKPEYKSDSDQLSALAKAVTEEDRRLIFASAVSMQQAKREKLVAYFRLCGMFGGLVKADATLPTRGTVTVAAYNQLKKPSDRDVGLVQVNDHNVAEYMIQKSTGKQGKQNIKLASKLDKFAADNFIPGDIAKRITDLESRDKLVWHEVSELKGLREKQRLVVSYIRLGTDLIHQGAAINRMAATGGDAVNAKIVWHFMNDKQTDDVGVNGEKVALSDECISMKFSYLNQAGEKDYSGHVSVTVQQFIGYRVAVAVANGGTLTDLLNSTAPAKSQTTVAKSWAIADNAELDSSMSALYAYLVGRIGPTAPKLEAKTFWETLLKDDGATTLGLLFQINDLIDVVTSNDAMRSRDNAIKQAITRSMGESKAA